MANLRQNFKKGDVLMEKAPIRNRAYGKEVQKRLIELDMNQKELALRVGIDPKRMSDIIRGVYAGWKHRDKIAKVLGLPQMENELRYER
jgi:plasmid maintenance system antidote protein VapI